jgi:hypothetical protein
MRLESFFYLSCSGPFCPCSFAGRVTTGIEKKSGKAYYVLDAVAEEAEAARGGCNWSVAAGW